MASDWLKIRQKRLKARQSRQNQVYLAYSSQKQVRYDAGQSQYDMTLANRRAPGVWFVLGFRMYLFLEPKWQCIPFFWQKAIRLPLTDTMGYSKNLLLSKRRRWYRIDFRMLLLCLTHTSYPWVPWVPGRLNARLPQSRTCQLKDYLRYLLVQR